MVARADLAAGWRWAVLLTALFAAIATPTGDALSMFVLMVPDGACCTSPRSGVGAVLDRRRDARRAAAGLG